MPVDRGSVRIEKARPGDAGRLARISQRAFDNDIHYDAPGPGGPPGYDSERWQARMIRMSDYYRIEVDNHIAGGLIVFRKRAREYEVGRIFINPDHQNQGIGAEVFECLWRQYPLAKRWTLDTPAWNQRTRAFYAKLGFQEIRVDDEGLVYFEKLIMPPRHAEV